MKAERKRTTRYVLELTDKEALWLKRYMQNPIGDLVDEAEEDTEMREALFAVLPPFSLKPREYKGEIG